MEQNFYKLKQRKELKDGSYISIHKVLKQIDTLNENTIIVEVTEHKSWKKIFPVDIEELEYIYVEEDVEIYDVYNRTEDNLINYKNVFEKN